MRRTVGKALVAGTAALTVAVLVPGASASAFGDSARGGCYAATASNDVVTNGQNQGVIGDNSVTTDASGLPTAATVSCSIQVNGVEAPGTRQNYSGTGVQSGMSQVAFTASSTDDVEVCQWVGYADGSTDARTCKPVSQGQVPPLPDVDAAYCPYGSITGAGTWTPPETATPAPHVFVWDTNANCTSWGDEAGAYHIVFNGTSNDACTVGTGSGQLSGFGPEGAIIGSFTFYRGGIHLYISGTFVSGGEEHSLQYWLDVLASTDLCSYSTAPLIGHGGIVDQGS
ncbi:MAG: hypothetical protein JO079_10310 [Frankiaceae bacterium]|nr:hypothetical protein [Frankiaceae bacterium]MBV9369768.1 hypothetical protein [Frankiales bacterium]